LKPYSDFWRRLRKVEELLRLAEIRLDELEMLHSHGHESRSAGLKNGGASHRDTEAEGEVPIRS